MTMRETSFRNVLLAAAGLCVAASSGSAFAQSEGRIENEQDASTPPAITMNADPYAMEDGSWVSIYGKVTNSSAEGFDLDMGDTIVRVEMDDYDDWPEARALSDGMNVAVVGRVDDDLFELTTIEAGSVYIDGLNTVFWANPGDEEIWGDVAFYRLPDLSNVVLEGRISDVDIKEGRFSLTTGSASHVVSVDELGYNPFDEIGYQKISENDRVRVTGQLDADAIRTGELEATSIVSLRQS